MALPPRDQRHPFLRFEGLVYTDADITDFKGRLGNIYDRKVHKVLVFDFEGLTEMTEGVIDLDVVGTLQFDLGEAKRRPERYLDVTAGAPEVIEGAHADMEGDKAVLAPVQAPQPPFAAA
nr:hypothetical protein [Tanacetum cinerariifolium]